MTVLFGITISLLGAGPATASVPAASPAPTQITAGEENLPGSQWLASCLATGRTLSVLFILDVSGSLTSTDPLASRYAGLETALTTLATTSRQDGDDVTIEAAVAGFGNRYYSSGEIVPWQRINIDGPGSLIDSMVNQARDRTAWIQDGTGFQFVVEPATNELQSRGGAQSCKAVVWFTDGDPSDPEAVASMCRPGGVVDTMRQNGIVLIGLRLSQQGQREPTADMRTMTQGQSGSSTCGTVPIPEGYAPGIYLEATDVKRLFASIQNITEGCTPSGDLGLVVDPGIRRVRVNMITDQKVDSVRFDLPDGISFTAGTDGSSTPTGGEGIVVSSVSDDFYVSMELVLPPGVGVGEWLLSAAGAPTPEDIEFCVFADLYLAVNEASMGMLEAGTAGILQIDVLDTDDGPADLSVFETASTGVSLIGPDGLPRTADGTVDQTGSTIDLLVRTEPSDARLDLEATLTLTTASGLTLTPLRLESPIITALNEYYPKVAPLDELDLGEALREEPASAELTLVGSDRGPTEVCFGAPESIQVPAGATNADPVYPSGCISLGVGETRTLTVTASTTTAVEGDGSALIPIEIKAAPDSTGFEGVAELKLPVQWRFSNPLNVGILIWAVIAVVAISVLIPMIAILWANWVTARFDVTNLRVTKTQLVIDQSGVRRKVPIEGSDAIVGATSRQRPRGARKSIVLWGRELVRTFTVGDVTFRSRASLNPFRPARFWAESSDRSVLLSTFGSQIGRDARPNAAPFAPSFSAAAVWVADASNIKSAGPVEGELTVLVTTGGRREAKVDVEAVVAEAPWSSMLSQYRPSRDELGPERGGSSTPPPPPPPPPPRPRTGTASSPKRR